MEQTLRDLEGGAFCALTAFNRRKSVPESTVDQLADAWVTGAHADAQRLIAHANRQYETRFKLNWSSRPWVAPVDPIVPISGTKGHIWHAAWYMRERCVDLKKFWNDGSLDQVRDIILMACAPNPYSLEVSFAALEDADDTANAIGICFDLLLFHQRHCFPEFDWNKWGEDNADIDPRVQIISPWTIAEESATPISIFGA